MFIKNIVQRFLDIFLPFGTSSNFMRGLGWNNAAAAGGIGRQGSNQPSQPASKISDSSQRKYTAQEVKAYLRGQEQNDRARPVMEQASQFSRLLEERMRRHFRGRERIFDRLPYVLYQYIHGTDAREIARSVSYFSDSEDIEQAMEFAATLIANRVNRTNRSSTWF